MTRQAARQAARRRAIESMASRRPRPRTADLAKGGAATAPGDESSVCPRCGEPVRYAGRGRRPIWCSARCRTQASIERRGNRMVGVEPRVVRVVRAAVGPKAEPTSVSKRLTVGEWADMLGRFRHALAAGAIYDRELVQLVEPLGGVLEAFQRRSSRSQALAGGRRWR